MEECSLLGPEVVDGFKVCRLATCQKPLPLRRRRWCSDECSEWYATNHLWQLARDYVADRDRRICQKCHKQAYDWKNERDNPLRPVRGEDESYGAYRHRIKMYQRQAMGTRAEVNHKTPLVGSGYNAGCKHHVDGLELLCHSCHTKETQRQELERKMENARRFFANQRIEAKKMMRG